jgi:RNA polymerase sigma-70 factor, ECF subfamily
VLRVGELERTELQSVAGGSESAFLALVDRYQPVLARIAGFWFEQPSEIDVIVKQTWSSMLQRLDRFDERSSLKGWLCVTLIKLARQRKGPEADERLQLEAAAPGGPSVDPARFSPAGARWAGHWSEPPRDWPTHAALEPMQAALAALPHVERLLVVLRDSEQLSSLDVERALELDDATQQRVLHRGRSRIRAALEAHYRSHSARETIRKIRSLVELTCQSLTELVTEYMHGTLSEEECVHFEQHLHACTWCMTYLAQMRRTIALSARTPGPEQPVDRAALLDLYRDWQRSRP